MDLTTVVNLGLLLFAALAASVSAWQALDARRSRDESRKARDTALEASVASAAAATRSAAALEERNTIELSKISTDEWERLSAGTKHELRNISTGVLHTVCVEQLGGGASFVFDDKDWERDVKPRESIIFQDARGFGDTDSASVQVSWLDPATGERREQSFALS